jgi:hypothetical protein
MDDYFPIIDENINPCRGCPDYDEDGCKSNGGCGSPQTNADRVRAMTDEELADWLSIYCCRNKTYDAHCETFGSCEACWFAWLNEEVTE